MSKKTLAMFGILLILITLFYYIFVSSDIGKKITKKIDRELSK